MPYHFKVPRKLLLFFFFPRLIYFLTENIFVWFHLKMLKYFWEKDMKNSSSSSCHKHNASKQPGVFVIFIYIQFICQNISKVCLKSQ